MALTEHDKAHMERILQAYPRVKAKADAGHEGAQQRIKEYDAQLEAYKLKAGGK